MEHQQVAQKNNPQNDVAFVLGNGKSRLNLNLPELKSKGVIYGCNALYREFEPDHLIAVDVKMINEIVAAGYTSTHSVWTNPNKGVSSKSNVNFFNPHKGWSSGPTALWFACEQGHKKIYIFGFDYQGIEGKFNNVYANTFNYKKSDDAATYFGNWLSQTEKTIKEYRDVKFVRVIEKGTFIPDKLVGIPNLQHITYDIFSQEHEGCTYIHENHQKTVI
jgi:hypothetical protein